MTTLLLSPNARRPLNRQMIARPGPVGSVGDVLVCETHKGNLPGDIKYDKSTYGKNSLRYASHITDGQSINQYTGAYGAHVSTGHLSGGRSIDTPTGWKVQDLRLPDRRFEPTLNAIPKLTWRNKVAHAYDVHTTGRLFPVPQGGMLQSTGSVPRGGMVPRIVAVEGGDGEPSFIPFDNFKPNFHAGNTVPYTGNKITQQQQPRTIKFGKN